MLHYLVYSSSSRIAYLSVASLDVSGHLVVWLILETQTYEADSTDYGQTVSSATYKV